MHQTPINNHWIPFQKIYLSTGKNFHVHKHKPLLWKIIRFIEKTNKLTGFFLEQACLSAKPYYMIA
jgi:hypothetical protein